MCHVEVYLVVKCAVWSGFTIDFSAKHDESAAVDSSNCQTPSAKHCIEYSAKHDGGAVTNCQTQHVRAVVAVKSQTCLATG